MSGQSTALHNHGYRTLWVLPVSDHECVWGYMVRLKGKEEISNLCWSHPRGMLTTHRLCVSLCHIWKKFVNYSFFRSGFVKPYLCQKLSPTKLLFVKQVHSFQFDHWLQKVTNGKIIWHLTLYYYISNILIIILHLYKLRPVLVTRPHVVQSRTRQFFLAIIANILALHMLSSIN